MSGIAAGPPPVSDESVETACAWAALCRVSPQDACESEPRRSPTSLGVGPPKRPAQAHCVFLRPDLGYLDRLGVSTPSASRVLRRSLTRRDSLCALVRLPASPNMAATKTAKPGKAPRKLVVKNESAFAPRGIRSDPPSHRRHRRISRCSRDLFDAVLTAQGRRCSSVRYGRRTALTSAVLGELGISALRHARASLTIHRDCRGRADGESIANGHRHLLGRLGVSVQPDDSVHQRLDGARSCVPSSRPC